jgi:hypothetical protein
MTRATIRVTARVLPGCRIEVTAPELIEGTDVEVFVALPGPGQPGPMLDPDEWDAALDDLAGDVDPAVAPLSDEAVSRRQIYGRRA